MNSFVISFLISLLAGVSTLIGVIPIFIKIKQKNIDKFIVFSLSFSLSVMMGISIFDLIPSSFIFLKEKYNIVFLGILLILGFGFTFLMVRILNKKIDKKGQGSELFKLGILNMLVLVLHNLPEGIATFLSSYVNVELGLKLSLAIMLHNIPEGLCIAIPIYYATKDRNKAIKYTLISGLSEPVGALICYVFLKNYITMTLIQFVLLFVGCLMIILAIEKIFPEAIKYKEDKFVFIGILIGLCFIFISIFL